jgi:inner membrane protein
MLTALHFLTHVGIGCIVAGLGPGPRRDRWIIVLASLVPDLDGIGILWSEHAYALTHRIVGHGLLCGLVLTGAAALLADRRWITAALAAFAFHLHVLLDVVGTGGPPISYLWPLSSWRLTSDRHWTLDSWPNVVVMVVTLLGVIATAWWRVRGRAAPIAGVPAAALPARSTPPS